jgi:hypothetical protein
MARHGYLGDDYGSEYDPDYDADEGGGDRQPRSYGDGGDDRNFMLDDRDRSRRGEQSGQRSRGNQGQGYFSRMGEQAGSDANEWFGGHGQSQRGQQGQMSRYGREHGQGGFQGDFGGGGQQGGFGGRGDWGQQGGRQSFSSHPDAHYHSWREKQMQSLDRDYQDDCREREQEFHQNFDSWRQNRQSQSTGQSGQSGSQTGGQSNQGRGSTAPTGSTGSTMESASGSNDELLLSEKSTSMTGAPNEPMSATVSGDGGATMGQTPETTRRNR